MSKGIAALVWGPERRLGPGSAFPGLARFLVPLQLACFGALEVCERLLTGHGIAQLVTARVFLIGLALQVVVALVLALLAAALLRLARKLLWLARGRSRARARSVPALAFERVVRSSDVILPCIPRAPPPLVSQYAS